jgi:hypothetical protein
MLRARFMVRRGALKFHRIYLSWEEIAALVKVCLSFHMHRRPQQQKGFRGPATHISGPGGSSTTIGPSVRTMVGSVIRPVPAETTRNPEPGAASA